MTTPEVCQKCGRLAFPGDTVTVSAIEYEELRRFKAARTAVHNDLASYRMQGSGRIARDPELAAFIMSCAETMRTEEVRQACVERFGEDRVPHRTTIHRFIFGTGKTMRR